MLPSQVPSNSPANVTPSRIKEDQPRAVVKDEIGPAESFSDDEGNHLDEEEAEEGYEDPRSEDGQSIVGVSIGRAQSELASPSTPSAEKAAILERAGIDTFFPSKPKHTRAQNDLSDTASTNYQTTDLPSPWKPGPREMQIYDGASEDPKRPQGVMRQRSSTGPTEAEHGLKRFIPSMPSMPSSISSMVKSPSFPRINIPGVNNNRNSWFSFNEKDDRPKTGNKHRNSDSLNTIESSQIYSETGSSNLSTSSKLQYESKNHLAPRPQSLRRSTSDGSLRLQRSLSRASSLGDDNRWADVHEQVNSRMKAIKDSMADSNLKMPTLPNFSSLSLAGALSDFNLGRRKPHYTEIISGADISSEEQSKQAADSRNADASANTKSGMTKAGIESHPHFTRALNQTKGDVVILGGYRGSVLRSAEPPHRQLWVPIKVGLNLRKANLEVGLEAEDDERMTENIIPSGMLKNIGPVDISKRLFKRLRTSRNALEGKLRINDFGYDWRLNPELLSRQFIQYLEKLPCNSPETPSHKRGATVIAHSLGGLITRHAVNTRPELFAGIIYAGVPQTCVNILGPLRNGDDVLLSSKVLTAQVNFTIRTSYALLPLDGRCFINRETREEYPVDFFDPQTWEENCLSPCVARSYPALTLPHSGALDNIKGSMASVLNNVSIPGRRNSSAHGKNSGTNSRSQTPPSHSRQSSTPTLSEPAHDKTKQVEGATRTNAIGPRMDDHDHNHTSEDSISTAVSLAKPDAMRYLTRMLADVKRFKLATAFRPEMADRYPPVAVIYGKSTPTVYGAYVRDREAIKHADAYENLAFASGDGVVLARAAQVPEGYTVVKGGVVSSQRGHVSLLGDLEAVGKCLNALHEEKRRRAPSHKHEHAQVSHT